MARPNFCFHFFRRAAGIRCERDEALSSVDGPMDRTETIQGASPQRPLQHRHPRPHLHLVRLHPALVLVQLETTRRPRALFSPARNRSSLAANLRGIFGRLSDLGSHVRMAARLSVRRPAAALVALRSHGVEYYA